MEGLGREQTRQLEAPGSSIMAHSAATGMSETAADKTVPEGAEPVRQLSAQDQKPRNTFPLLLGKCSLAHGDECLGRPCIPPRYLAVRTTVQVQVQRDWHPSMAWHARGPYSVSGCRQSAHGALTRLVWGQHSPHLHIQI